MSSLVFGSFWMFFESAPSSYSSQQMACESMAWSPAVKE
jgi:hypothetical protein